MKGLWIAVAGACVTVPLGTSGPRGPQSGALEVLDATAAVLAAAAGAPAAPRAVALPPPARRPTAAKPDSSFLFMTSPLAHVSPSFSPYERAPACSLRARGRRRRPPDKGAHGRLAAADHDRGHPPD